MRLQAVLKKSIVFITHDFDEAIRVADRIAIMKDGAVVQIGSPEELVMAPTDAYVAEFTRNVSKSKVVRVSALIKPLPKRAPPGGYAGDIDMAQRIADAAPLFQGSDRPLRVLAPDRKPVGRLDHADVVKLMMQG